MTPAEFERVAAHLGELEDRLILLQELALLRSDDVILIGIEDCLRLAIAAHGQLHLELLHPELAADV